MKQILPSVPDAEKLRLQYKMGCRTHTMALSDRLLKDCTEKLDDTVYSMLYSSEF